MPSFPLHGGGSSGITSVSLTMPGEFSVAGSPVEPPDGTFIVSLANQTAHTVFCGPSSGPPGTPGFRLLAAADIPDLSSEYDVAGSAATAQGNAEAYTDSQIAGLSIPTAANPTSLIGLTVANGTSVHFMRSDAAPALDISIIPTWTGAHVFNGGFTVSTDSFFGAASAVHVLEISGGNTSGQGAYIAFDRNGIPKNYIGASSALHSNNTEDLDLVSSGNINIYPSTGLVGTFASGGLSLFANGIATTPTDVLLLTNTTAATSTITVQLSPAIHFHSAAWKTGVAAASISSDWRIYVKPNSAVGITSNLLFDYSQNGAAYATKLILSNSGALSGITSLSLPSLGLINATSGFPLSIVNSDTGGASSTLSINMGGHTGATLLFASGSPVTLDNWFDQSVKQAASPTFAGLTIAIGALQLGNTYVATPPTSTGYVTIKDTTGTTYKVLVST